MPDFDDGAVALETGAAARPSDEELAGRVRLGDRGAFEALARRYLPAVHSVVASYLREPADVEDAAQDAFLRALDRIRTYDPRRPFAPWLYQIARNVARNRRKRHGRLRFESLSGADVRTRLPGPEEMLDRAEIRAHVRDAMDRLPEQRRTAFRLHDVEGYSAREVGELMGLTEGTVRSHVHHARRALRAGLAGLLEREAPQ